MQCNDVICTPRFPTISQPFFNRVDDRPPGDNDIDVPPETPRWNFTHFLVYTASTLAEQTTPSSRDLGLGFLGGTVKNDDWG